MAAPTSYTREITPAQARALRELLAERGFEFADKPYALFSGAGDKVNVTVYEKGPKVLVQGKGTGDFVRFALEPEILGTAELGYEEVRHPDRFEPHFGIDESGKGDFLGPLVIAGAYVDGRIARTLVDAGVTDSKKIASDARIRSLATTIRELPGSAFEVITISPARYNELYRKIGNLNRLLAWGHARVIENLLAKRPDCPRALSDQFANPKVLERSLMEKGRSIHIEQRTKAESDPAVAAASILAREAFIDWMRDKGEEAGLGEPLPKGVSPKVKKVAAGLVRRLGPECLPAYAKMHFKTAAEIEGAGPS